MYYSRKSTRIHGYDYSKDNYYFLTICTHEHKCIFGKPGTLNVFGKIAENDIQKISEYYPSVRVDKYVVMPNHIHIILAMDGQKENPNINLLMALYKSGVTKRIHRINQNTKVWQRSFHDHIIRNQASYERIWMYIENNPLKWEEDCFYQKHWMREG